MLLALLIGNLFVSCLSLGSDEGEPEAALIEVEPAEEPIVTVHIINQTDFAFVSIGFVHEDGGHYDSEELRNGAAPRQTISSVHELYPGTDYTASGYLFNVETDQYLQITHEFRTGEQGGEYEWIIDQSMAQFPEIEPADFLGYLYLDGYGYVDPYGYLGSRIPADPPLAKVLFELIVHVAKDLLS